MGKRSKPVGKTPTYSGGTSHHARARRARVRLLMKIRRWERYQTDPQKSPLGKHRGPGKQTWNTEGLQRHLKHLEKVIGSPAKRG